MNPYEKLAKIKEILLSEEQKVGDPKGFFKGQPYTVSNHAYYNMEGALIDLERAGGIADDVVIKTFRRVQHQIGEVIKILEEPDTWDEDGPLSASISDISEGAHQDDWSHPKIEDKEH